MGQRIGDDGRLAGEQRDAGDDEHRGHEFPFGRSRRRLDRRNQPLQQRSGNTLDVPAFESADNEGALA